MDILRYKWSAVVAASLHGALFLGSPHPRVIPDSKVIADPLPPLPKEILQFEEPMTREDSGDKPVASSRAMPDIPETPTPPIMDRPTLIIPVEENTTVRPVDTNLIFRPESIDGPSQVGEKTPGSFSLPKDLDRVPRATAQMPPDYPSTMRQSGETGSVMVEFEVDTLGRVIRAVAVRYTHREFVDPAVRAVLRWHFEPGKRHGKTVPFRMAVPIEFGLSAN
jgi:protein TonB